MARRTHSIRNRIAAAAVATVMVAAAVLASTTSVQHSIAFFSDTTTSQAAVSAGEVTVAAGGTVNYSRANIVPGWSDSFTVNVTNSSTVPVQLRAYASTSATGALANAVDVTVTRSGTTIFTGKASALPTTFAAANAHQTSAASVPYVFAFSLADSGNQNALQGTSLNLAMTYEARSVAP